MDNILGLMINNMMMNIMNKCFIKYIDYMGVCKEYIGKLIESCLVDMISK